MGEGNVPARTFAVVVVVVVRGLRPYASNLVCAKIWEDIVSDMVTSEKRLSAVGTRQARPGERSLFSYCIALLYKIVPLTCQG